MICPEPLATATSSEHYTWYVYGNCTVPCPTIEYTEYEWNAMVSLLRILSTIALVLSFFSLSSHLYNFDKYFIQCMFIGGFFVESLATVIFLYANGGNAIVCDGSSHFIERSTLCIIQAAVLIFSMLWVEVWSVIFMYDLYINITSVVTKARKAKNRYIYVAIATIISTALTMVPIVENNLGFDPEANIPFCLYMISETDVYFWYTLFLPLVTLIFISITYAILVAIRMNQIFVMNNNIDIELSKRSINDAPIASDFEVEDEDLGNDFESERGYESSVRGTNSVMGRDTLADERASSYSSSDYVMSVHNTAQICINPVYQDHDADSIVRSNTLGNSSGSTYTATTKSSAANTRSETREVAPNTAGASRGTSTILANLSIRFLIMKFLPTKWAKYIIKTWKYNGMAIVFVMTFCLTTLIVAPMVFELFYMSYGASVHGGEEFAGCLITASFASIAYGIPQTQDAVDEFAEGMCGDTPEDRPNPFYVRSMF